MSSNIRICSRKFEDEITEEEKTKLDYLGKQYRRLLVDLKNNENVIKYKKNLGFFFFIGFIYSFISICVFTLTKIKNELFQCILGLGSTGINIYVYIFFYNLYIKDAENTSDKLLEEIDKTTKEIDKILNKYNLDNKEFYKKYETNIIN